MPGITDDGGARDCYTPGMRGRRRIMALQIEAPETIRMIEDLARRTGEGAETVVRVAVQERLARLRTPEEEAERRARVYETVRELNAIFKEHPDAITDHGELLYGEDGLPR
jgi:hypothetical protein